MLSVRNPNNNWEILETSDLDLALKTAKEVIEKHGNGIKSVQIFFCGEFLAEVDPIGISYDNSMARVANLTLKG